MRYLLTTLILGLMLQSALIYAQSPIVEWSRVYNGDAGYCVEQTSDSGYIVAGEIFRAGARIQDLYLIKTNSSGDTVWTKNYQTGNSNSAGYAILQASDGGFVTTGICADMLYVIKTNGAGGLLWSRTFTGDVMTWGNAGFSITQTPDNCFVAVGFSCVWGGGDDVFMVKLTNDGDTSWVKRYSGSHWERGFSVSPTSDSGLIVAGSIRPASTLDYWDDPWFMKTDAAGNTEWIKTYDWLNVNEAKSILQTPDGGYLAAGYTNSFGAGDFAYFLLKLDSEGDSLWCKIYGTDYSNSCYSLKSLNDGNYILGGTEWTLPYNVPRILLIKVNPSGDTLWTKIISSTGNALYGYCVDVTSDNGYIVSGKLGTTYLVKLLEPPINVKEEQSDLLNAKYFLCENYPNPFNPSTTIKYQIPELSFVSLKIYDLLGNEIETLVNEEKPAGNYKLTWNATSTAGRLPSGVYFYQLRTGSFIETKKMILLK